MSPIRILILAILFYLAFRLILGGREKKKHTEVNKEGVGKSDDVLEEDPICGRLVPRRQAVRFEDKKEAVYFCSEKCKKEYRKKKGEQQ